MYYTYIYLDPRKPGKYQYSKLNKCFLYEPFYVGKGKGTRISVHLRNSSLSTKSVKNNKIKAIMKSGLNPFSVIYHDNLLETEALHEEITIISAIGRLDDKSGVLTNATAGGDNVSEKIAPKKWKSVYKIDYNTNEIIDTYKSVTDAGKINNIAIANINACCVGVVKSAGGFKWKYCDYQLESSKRDIKILMLNSEYSLLSEKESAINAAKEYNICLSKIINCCKGLSCGKDGIIWEYADIPYELRMQYRSEREAINSRTEKPIRRVCKITGEEKIYVSMNEAADDNSITASMVNMIAKGKRGRLLSYKLYYVNDKSYDEAIEKENSAEYAKRKPILQFDLNGNFIREWASATIASTELKVSHSRICTVARGKANKAGGFKWLYK